MDGEEGPIYLMMPINLRPPQWRLEVVGNYASYVSVRLATGEQTSLGRAIRPRPRARADQGRQRGGLDR